MHAKKKFEKIPIVREKSRVSKMTNTALLGYFAKAIAMQNGQKYLFLTVNFERFNSNSAFITLTTRYEE